MRLILALSIALGTANLQFVPNETEIEIDRMTRAADSTRAQVAASTQTPSMPRQQRTAAVFDRAPAVANITTRDVGSTPSASPSVFSVRVAVDSTVVAADDGATVEATGSPAVR